MIYRDHPEAASDCTPGLEQPVQQINEGKANRISSVIIPQIIIFNYIYSL